MDGMELLKLAVQIAIGLAAGGFTAAGYFAVITSVGMINRIVDVTNTKAYIPYFEEVIIWGASLGNVWFIFDLPLPAGMRRYIRANYTITSGPFTGGTLNAQIVNGMNFIRAMPDGLAKVV
jgi:stage V sporulation protein AB